MWNGMFGFLSHQPLVVVFFYFCLLCLNTHFFHECHSVSLSNAWNCFFLLALLLNETKRVDRRIFAHLPSPFGEAAAGGGGGCWLRVLSTRLVVCVLQTHRLADWLTHHLHPPMKVNFARVSSFHSLSMKQKKKKLFLVVSPCVGIFPICFFSSIDHYWPPTCHRNSFFWLTLSI